MTYVNSADPLFAVFVMFDQTGWNGRRSDVEDTVFVDVGGDNCSEENDDNEWKRLTRRTTEPEWRLF
ncbi:MAG: hypothetical protein IPL32_04890 [Chloracidobacterium sp.]|nr:hypothetical protein [Chloracidobacterium sp.]